MSDKQESEIDECRAWFSELSTRQQADLLLRMWALYAGILAQQGGDQWPAKIEEQRRRLAFLPPALPTALGQ